MAHAKNRPGQAGNFGLLLALAAVFAGCGFEPPPADSASTGANVFVTDVEQLAPPAVASASVYQPAFVFPIDPADPSAGETAGFFLTVLTADCSDLTLRLRNRSAGSTLTLDEIPPPDDINALQAGQNWTLSTPALNRLRNGLGIFWSEPCDAGTGPVNRRLAVAVPMSELAPSVTLEVADTMTSDGTPVGGDQIELVRGFFYLAAIGDSVIWGNGLRDEDKFSTLVAAEIERRTGLRVIRQVHAISGSTIVPGENDTICPVRCNGEAQLASTPIVDQVDLIESPESIDLILMDGCINDIRLGKILNPLTEEEALVELTQQFCRDAMITLLHKVRDTAPQAAIVVTTYYPIVSEETDLQAFVDFLDALGVSLADVAASVLTGLTANSTLFWETSCASVAEAAETVFAENPAGPPIVVVEPAFGMSNAVLASDPWLWGLTRNRPFLEPLDIDIGLLPEDPMAALRINACASGPGDPDPVMCLYASVGHPNRSGAQAYADAIIAVLGQIGVEE